MVISLGLYQKQTGIMEILLVVVINLIILHISGVLCFNINTGAVERYEGPADSSFGFSLDQVVINGSKWIIVGAPFALGNKTRDGAVYKCYNSSCHQMAYNTEVPRTSLTNSSLSMIGASVTASTRDAVVIACAPRYTYFHNDFLNPDDAEIYMMGACFVYDGKTDTFSRRPHTPCMPGSNVNIRNIHKPCAAGFSSSNLEGENTFVIGGLGTDKYKGQYIRMDIGNPKDADYGLVGAEAGDYSGYAVETGSFSGRDILDIVAGAPRANDHLGQVNLYQRQVNGGWRHLQSLSGQQFGEYYGSVLAVGDLNGDGLDDLVVGAPFHANNVTRIADVGCVYVYYQAKFGTQLNAFSGDDVTILRGNESTSGRFGFSLAVLQDVDQDGHNDLAVGSPQEEAVYIFLGSADGIRSDPSQVIHARDVEVPPFGIRTGFGSALVGDLDMDGNSYTDLVVGARDISKAYLFRSHPVMTVNIRLAADITYIKLDEECPHDLVESAVSCFQLNTYLKYDGMDVPPQVDDLKLSWNLDVDNITDSIVLFKSELLSGHRSPNFTDVVSLQKKRQLLVTHIIFITSSIVEYDQPLKMQVGYSLVNPPDRFDVRDPVLDMKVPHYQATQVLVYRPPSDLSLRVQSMARKAVLGVDQLIEVNVTVVNKLSTTSYNAEIVVDLPPGVIYSSVNGARTVTCLVPEKVKGVVLCSLGFIFLPYETVSFVMRTVIGDVKPLYNMTTLHYKFNLTSINDVNLGNNTAEVELQLESKATVQVTGASSPDQLQITAETENQNVTHIFELTNHGPSPLIAMEIWISWPMMTSDNIPLLGLEGRPVVSDNKGRCHAEEHQLRPMPMTQLEACNSDEDPAYFLCQQIHCNTDEMAAEESIVINITSVITNDIIKLSKVDNSWMLNSTATVTGQGYPGVVMNGVLVDRAVIQTQISFPGVSRDEKVSWWIYVVSFLIGVVVLVAVVLLLWRLGFFKRNSRERLYSAKRESQMMNFPEEDMDDDDDDGAIYPMEDRVGDAGDEPDADKPGTESDKPGTESDKPGMESEKSRIDPEKPDIEAEKPGIAASENDLKGFDDCLEHLKGI